MLAKLIPLIQKFLPAITKLLDKFLSKKSNVKTAPAPVSEVPAAPAIVFQKDLISLQDLLTSSNKYPARAKSSELTEEMKKEGEAFLKKVNALLKELDIVKVDVTSGFRPSATNAAVGGAAKSWHQRCRAIDLKDDDSQTLAKLIQSRPDLLKKHGLWLEHPEATNSGPGKAWCHLDDSDTRRDREVRVFRP